ncbi:MAG: hypothetical protein ACLFVO_01925 [Chloroflexaceae bacterium]
MDPVAAEHLAEQLATQRTLICARVTTRLLLTFPELVQTLRMEAATSVEARLSEVASERMYELVRAILLFGLPNLAEQELRWAVGVLPRSGVTTEHQAAMIRWFFEETRQIGLEPAEIAITQELEQYMLDLLTTLTHTPSS